MIFHRRWGVGRATENRRPTFSIARLCFRCCGIVIHPRQHHSPRQNECSNELSRVGDASAPYAGTGQSKCIGDRIRHVGWPLVLGSANLVLSLDHHDTVPQDCLAHSKCRERTRRPGRAEDTLEAQTLSSHPRSIFSHRADKQVTPSFPAPSDNNTVPSCPTNDGCRLAMYPAPIGEFERRPFPIGRYFSSASRGAPVFTLGQSLPPPPSSPPPPPRGPTHLPRNSPDPKIETVGHLPRRAGRTLGRDFLEALLAISSLVGEGCGFSRRTVFEWNLRSFARDCDTRGVFITYITAGEVMLREIRRRRPPHGTGLAALSLGIRLNFSGWLGREHPFPLTFPTPSGPVALFCFSRCRMIGEDEAGDGRGATAIFLPAPRSRPATLAACEFWCLPRVPCSPLIHAQTWARAPESPKGTSGDSIR